MRRHVTPDEVPPEETQERNLGVVAGEYGDRSMKPDIDVNCVFAALDRRFENDSYARVHLGETSVTAYVARFDNTACRRNGWEHGTS